MPSFSLWLIDALLLMCVVAGAYQAVALIACIRQLRCRDPVCADVLPPVSVLKPIHGSEQGFYEAILSHASQDYPEFEILFGVTDPSDAAIPDIRRLQSEFPHIRIELLVCGDTAGNPKVSKLITLAERARHPFLLVNDSDILVGPQYLRNIVPFLLDAAVGLVTCLYRVRAQQLPGRWEALAIATDFAPSTLVAPLAGVKEFALGSTLLFRAADLERIGGFSAIGDYVADDYQLAKRITALGKRVHLAREVVDTGVQDSGWIGMWRHQVRWQRMIRVSRAGGYAGLPVTFATAWALIALVASQPLAAAGVFALRMSVALVAGVGVLRCPETARLWPLVPVRDLVGMAVWTAALFGRTVRWRGEDIELGKQGRIVFRNRQFAPPAAEPATSVNAGAKIDRITPRERGDAAE